MSNFDQNQSKTKLGLVCGSASLEERVRREKRILPRYPYNTMTFKLAGENISNAFEVLDISPIGMQIFDRSGASKISQNASVLGILSFKGERIRIEGKVRWAKEKKMGIIFNESERDILSEFLSLKKVVRGFMELHKDREELEVRGLSPLLKYWFKGEGPVELFLWSHPWGGIQKIQIVIFDTFIEWEDGKGLQTALARERKDFETPLIQTDEYLFEFDCIPDNDKLARGRELAKELSSAQMAETDLNPLLQILSLFPSR